VGFRKTNWLQPELCHVVTVLNIDMRRLQSFKAVEKEAETGNAQDSRRRRILMSIRVPTHTFNIHVFMIFRINQ
jgi:hypothetical protein